MATEVGVAYVRLLPSMAGFSGEASKGLKSGLAKPAKDAGKNAGAALGDGISDGVGKSKGRFKSAAGRVGSFFTTALKGAGVAGALMLAAGFTSGLDLQASQDKLAAQIGGDWGEEAGEIAGRLYGNAFGQSVTETGDAVRRVFQAGLLPDDAGSEAFENLTAQALTFVDVMDQDLNMSIQGVSAMLRSGLVDSAEEGFDVLTTGIQAGADQAGDLAETFQEYSSLFRDLGLDATTATGLMSQGLQGGARDADKVADALKEVAIRAQDGSKASAEGFAAIGLSAEEMTAKFAAGGDAAREGLDEVLTGLKNIEDPVARNAAAVALFGTQAEDLGDALFALDLDTAAADMGETAGATDALGEAYDNAATKVEEFKRKGLQKLTDFMGDTVIPMFEEFGPQILDSFAELGPAVADMGPPLMELASAVGGALSAIAPVLPPLISGIAKFVDVIAAGGPIVVGLMVGLTAAWKLFGIQALLSAAKVALAWVISLGPIALVGIAIAALALLIITHFDTVKGWISAAMDFVLGKLQRPWNWAKDNWPQLVGILTNPIGAAKAAIDTAMGFVLGAIRGPFDWVRNNWSSILRFLVDPIGTAKTEIGRRIDDIVAWFAGLPGRIGQKLSGMVSAVLGPFQDAANAVVGLWNSTVGRLTGPSLPTGGFSMGRSFTPSRSSRRTSTRSRRSSVRRYHTGGIFSAESGGEGLALLEHGEGVFTREQMAAIGASISAQPVAPAKIVISGDGLDRDLLTWLRRSIRAEGGDVQAVLGAV